MRRSAQQLRRTSVFRSPAPERELEGRLRTLGLIAAGSLNVCLIGLAGYFRRHSIFVMCLECVGASSSRWPEDQPQCEHSLCVRSHMSIRPCVFVRFEQYATVAFAFQLLLPWHFRKCHPAHLAANPLLERTRWKRVLRLCESGSSAVGGCSGNH